MKTIYLAFISLLFFLPVIASDITYISDRILYAIKQKPFSEMVKHIDINNINTLYKSTIFGNYPPETAATILEHVCSYGEDDTDKLQKVQWLVEHGAFITDQTICNVARLRHTDDVKIMSYLLHKGGNVNAKGMGRDDRNVTALHNAILANFIHDHKIPMIELLLKHGADVNSKHAPFDNNPLHFAAKHCRNPRIIELLLAHGAQIDAENSYKENILHIAAKNSTSVPIIKTILKHTNLPLVNKKEFYYQETPLHIAARNLHNKPHNIIALLKCPQIDIEIQNSNYAGKKTALQIAKGVNHKTTGRVLVRFKTLKQLLSKLTWGDPINHLSVPLQIPEKLLIHKIAYWAVKIEFAHQD